MRGCPECPSEEEHEPEECPAATMYYGGTTGACESWFLRYDPEGIELSLRREAGGISEVDYYHELIDGTEMMHNVGACGL